MADGTVAADQLRLFIERIERLEEEKKGIADDIKDVYAEAKATVTTPRRCGRSSGCGRWRPTPGRKPTRCWRPIAQALGLE